MRFRRVKMARGRIALVAANLASVRVLRGSPRFAVARAPALYAIGTIAVYWSIGRIVSILA